MKKIFLLYLELSIMVMIWSLSFIIVDIGVEFVPPITLALYRFVLASISFVLIHGVKKFKSYFYKEDKYGIINNLKMNTKDWMLTLVASFSGISFFFYIQYTSIELIGPSLPALFVCLLAPVIITMLALIFFQEKINLYKIIGFIIGTFGAYFLITGGDLSVLNPRSKNFLGYILALITPFLWAIYSTSTKLISNDVKNLTILENLTYLGTLELIIFLILNGEILIFINNLFNPILFFCAIYLGIGCHVICYYIWNNSQRQIESSKASSFLYIEPFMTLLFSFLLQRSEVIVFLNVFGGIIVLIAVLIINFK